MRNKFLVATILSIGLSTGLADEANAREADVEVNFSVLQRLNPSYQPPSNTANSPQQRRTPVYQPSAASQFIEPSDGRVVAQAPIPQPKPKYTPKKTAPIPQLVAADSSAQVPLNATLPSNYDPAMFAPKGPSLKVTTTKTEEVASLTPVAPPAPPAPTIEPPALVVPPAPTAPAPVKLSEMPRRAPEMQGNAPASSIPAPLPVPPAMPKLAELPKADVKPAEAKPPVDKGTLEVKPVEKTVAALTPPAPPPLVIKPEEMVIESNSKPLLSPKDALEPPKINLAPTTDSSLTLPAPPPPMPDASKKVSETKLTLPPLPAPAAPPSVKDLPPLPTAKKEETDLTLPPPPSQLPSLDKLFEKKTEAATLPPEQTVASKEAVTVQTAGLPSAIPPAAPAAASSEAISIPYAEAEVEIPPSEQVKLQSIADMLAADKNAKVSIAAYASGTEDQVALALRTSFGRAVKIRKFFIDRNISEDRINVKALGNKSTSGVPDRVDVSVGKSG